MDYTWKDSYRKQIARTGDACDALYRDRRYIIVSGHRGMKALYPENTLLSFEKAIEAGVDSLEMDVNITADGIPVVCHDLTLDRTTDGTGPIRAHTLAAIQALDAGAKHPGGSFAGQGLRIPTLETFCQLVETVPYLLLNVEIKDRTAEAADRTMAVLGAFGLLPRCALTCFDARIVHHLVDTYGVKAQGFLPHRMPNFVPGRDGTNARLYAIGLGLEDLTPQSVAAVEAQGILAWSWCPDTPEAVEKCVQGGARLMTCNDPRPALEWVGAAGRRMPH